jgi:hypothetical protein
MKPKTRERPLELESVWRTGVEFLAQFQRDPSPGTFFHPFSRSPRVPARLEAGDLFAVLVRFLDRKAEFRLHARVVEVRRGATPPGVVLALLPEEKERRELVLACAEGESVPYRRRRHHRLACSLAARVTPAKGPALAGTVTSLSEGGLRVLLDRPLESDTPVRAALSFPGRLRKQEVAGRVTSTIAEGDRHSVGVEFLFESQKQRDQVGKLVGALRLKLLASTPSD